MTTTTILALVYSAALLAAVILAAWIWGWISEQLDNDERGGRS